MKQTSLLSYAKVDRALRKCSLKPHPSEVHGLITGMLCGKNKKEFPTNWEVQLLGINPPQEARDVLELLQQWSAKQLVNFSFEFTLLLPEDTEQLALRAEALRLWCEGFIIGLEKVNIKVTGRAPSDTTEAINDITEIIKMDLDPVEDEADENAYTQLVEYIRMAAILIYQNVQDDEHPRLNPPSSPLH